MHEALSRFLLSPVSVIYAAGYSLWLALLLLEAGWSRVRGLGLYAWRDTLVNAVMYAGYFLINLFWVHAVFRIYTFVHAHAIVQIGIGAGVDHAALLQTPAPRQVMKTPHVQTVQNMIPVHVCDWIIARAQERLVRARVFDPVSGEGRSTVMRTNRDTRFQFHELDLVQIMILRRIGAMTGFDFKAMEPTSVLHYQVGEQFRQHFDYLDPGAYADEVKANGQRVGTFLIYLNDNFDGGETFFPITTFKHRGRRGDGLIFRNVTAAGAPDRLTLHAGLAPTRGEKWLFSQWIRERPKKPG